MTLQQLFDRWYTAERNVVVEYEHDIVGALAGLESEAIQFANEYALIFNPEGFLEVPR